MASDENDGEGGSTFPQAGQELQARHTGHAHVDDQAAVTRRVEGIEELLRRSKRLRRDFFGTQQKHQGIPDCLVIIDNGNHATGIVHLYSARGRVSRNTTPLESPGSKDRRPPCASTMDRVIVNPKPIPCTLVVAKG
jgi:hypothetical protein